MGALLAAQADVNACMTVDSRHSPLTIAAYQGNATACELLLARNANVRYAVLPKDTEPCQTAGGTAADLARERGHGALAAMLAGRLQEDILLRASAHGNEAVVRDHLAANPADVHVTTQDGRTV